MADRTEEKEPSEDSPVGRADRWSSAARTAAAAFGPNYRRAREAQRGRTLISFTRVIAWLYIAGTTLFAIETVVSDFTSRFVSLTLPVQQFWPTLPKGAHITGGPTAHVTGGGFSEAAVTVSGLDGAVRGWLAASALLQDATIIVIAIVVATLCATVLHDDPFRPALSRGIRVMSITVIVGGLAWQVCSGIAGRLASDQVLRLRSAEFKNTIRWNDITTIIGFPHQGGTVQVDFWPIWLGLALLALSAVFRYGMQLKRDTEGLI